MHEMHDMGRKEEAPTAEGKRKEPQIRYPSFSMVGGQILDELKNVKNNEMCRLEIIVRKVGDNIDTYTEGQPRRIEVEIHKVGYIAHAGKKTFDEYNKFYNLKY